LVFTQTAPTPPVKANGFSPTISPGPSIASETAPVENGRGLPYSSVARNTTRVASLPSPTSSASSGSTNNCTSAPFPEKVLVMASLPPR